MKQQRRLWIEAMVPLLEQVVEIHQRVHTVFGHKLNRPHAFPLFQGKRLGRTIIYNAEYDEAGKFQRGVFFITTGAVAQPIASEQWWIGSGRGHWRLTPRSLSRLARRIHNAVADEWNLDLGALKMPIKLVDWIDSLATEYAQSQPAGPEPPAIHQELAAGVFSSRARGCRRGVLPAARRSRHDCCRLRAGCRLPPRAARLGPGTGHGAKAALARSKPPELWINLTPGEVEGAVLGFPRPSPTGLPFPAGFSSHGFPAPTPRLPPIGRCGRWSTCPLGRLYEVTASFAEPKNPARLESWAETLHAIEQAGQTGRADMEPDPATRPRIGQAGNQGMGQVVRSLDQQLPASGVEGAVTSQSTSS